MKVWLAYYLTAKETLGYMSENGGGLNCVRHICFHYSSLIYIIIQFNSCLARIPDMRKSQIEIIFKTIKVEYFQNIKKTQVEDIVSKHAE